MTAVDLQRHVVYLAEHRWMSLIDAPDMTVREAQQLSTRVVNSSTWKSLAPSSAGVIVRGGVGERDFSYAEGNASILNIAENHLKAPVVLHEMVHVLMMRVFGKHTLQAHGPQFVSVYRLLVQEMFDESEFALWEESFDHAAISRDDRRVAQRMRT